jgi:hypothetical protein
MLDTLLYNIIHLMTLYRLKRALFPINVSSTDYCQQRLNLLIDYVYKRYTTRLESDAHNSQTGENVAVQCIHVVDIKGYPWIPGWQGQ